jgi:hypothetical protein
MPHEKRYLSRMEEFFSQNYSEAQDPNRIQKAMNWQLLYWIGIS